MKDMVELIVIFQGKPKLCEKVLAFNMMNEISVDEMVSIVFEILRYHCL